MIPAAKLQGLRRWIAAAGRMAKRRVDRQLPIGGGVSEAFLRPGAAIT